MRTDERETPLSIVPSSAASRASAFAVSNSDVRWFRITGVRLAPSGCPADRQSRGDFARGEDVGALADFEELVHGHVVKGLPRLGGRPPHFKRLDGLGLADA